MRYDLGIENINLPCFDKLVISETSLFELESKFKQFEISNYRLRNFKFLKVENVLLLRKKLLDMYVGTIIFREIKHCNLLEQCTHSGEL